jgi:hypothetical protein
MRARIGLAVLLFSVLFWTPDGPAAQLAGSRLESLQTPLQQPASVTVPPEAPVVVTSAAAPNTRGFVGSAAVAPTQDLTDDVLSAYTLAVAASPAQCHLTTPVLAAIGQVESGNLAGRSLDAGHRVVPEILGPVLDGKNYRAVEDTDAGHWDHNPVWDRALGPMQIIPASWRVVGLDMDGDGVRDPQDIYDAAGAAMVYLCADGRDLSTADGLKSAILSYNDSADYLRTVLAWKSVFDDADLDGIGAVPFVAALEVPATTVPTTRATVSKTPAVTPSTTAADPVSPTRPISHGTATTPASPTSPTTPATPGTPGTPPTPATTPGTPSTPATPSAPTTPAAPSTPADPPKTEPDPTPTPDPDPTLPPCPIPTPTPTDAPTDQAQSDTASDDPVVSEDTCEPPDGYWFDPDTGLLVPVPTMTPAP